MALAFFGEAKIGVVWEQKMTLIIISFLVEILVLLFTPQRT